MRPMIVSPFMYDVLQALYGGATPYLARKRAELNEQRRIQERQPTAGESFEGIFRSVAPREAD